MPDFGEKTDIVYLAVYLNILAVFIHDDQDFFARLGHIKPFSYLPFFAGLASQPRRFRRQFRISCFQFNQFLFYFFGFLDIYPAFLYTFTVEKTSARKTIPRIACNQPE